MPNKQVLRDVILVLGMHRSGTSAVTGVLGKLGAALPTNLMAGASSNERGHFESDVMKEFHDELLLSAGSSWDDWRPFNPSWYKAPAAKTFIAAAKEKFIRDFSERPLVVLKDPRICRFVPFWLNVVDKLEGQARAIIPVRSPLEVAMSLQKRDGIPRSRALLLWLRHALDAEIETREISRSIFRWDEFLSDWQSVTEKISRDIEVNWSRFSDKSRSEIDSFLSPNLNHHHVDDAKIARHPEIHEWTREAYCSLLDLTKDASSRSAMSALDQVRTDFNKACNLFGRPFVDFEEEVEREKSIGSTLREERDKLHVELATTRGAFQDQLNALEQQLEAVRSWTDELKVQLERSAQQTTETGAKLMEAEANFREAETARLAESVARSRAEAQIAQLEEAITTHQEAAQRQAETLDKFEAAAAHALEQRDSELAALRGKTGERIDALERMLEKTEQRLEQSQAELLEKNTAHSKSTAKIALVEARLKENLDRLKTLDQTIRERDEQLGGVAQKLQTMNQVRDHLKRSLNESEAENAVRFREREAFEALLGGAVEQLRKIHAETPMQRWVPLSTRRLAGTPWNSAVIDRCFDRERYLKLNSDVAAAGVDPLNHFLIHGWLENRVHGALFDDAYYATSYPESADLGIPLLYHYCSVGWREGRDPSALFDTRYYLEAHPEVDVSGLDPLSHFIHHGLKSGYWPNAQIDPSAFLEPLDWELSGFALATRLAMRLQSSALSMQGISLPAAADPEISVVIPVHNKFELTLACLQSIERLLPHVSFEVIVIDDVSRDLTPLVVPNWAGVRYLRNAQNQGFVGSCNRAAASARGRYILFLNNDTEVVAGWLDELVRTYQMHDNVGIVGSKLVYPDGRLQEAGGIIWEDASGWNYGKGEDPQKPEFNYVRDVDYVSGAALMIRTDLFWSAGAFDRRFHPAYFEDVDLCFAVRQAGYRVLYQPLSTVIHYEGASAGTDTGSGMKRFQEINKPKFQEKWAAELSSHLPNAQTPHIARERNIQRRVLIIDSTTPTPDQDAGSLNLSYIIQVLQNLGFKVTFIPEDNFAHIGNYTDDLQRRGVETIHRPYATSVAEHLETHGQLYDLIMPFRAPRIVRYFDDLRRLAPQAKIVVNTVDLHFLRMMREAEISGSEEKRTEALAVRDIEFDVMRRADSSICLSTEEMELLARELPEAKTSFLSLILDVPGRQVEFEQSRDICFVGGFRHTPNVDAVLWFHREIWPLVKEQLPDVRFRIIGSHAPGEILKLRSKNVLIDGHVPDLGATLGYCRVSVAPLRYGAGVKGKIGSSLSYGIPTVSTSIGSEGMGLAQGREILTADTPEAFAAAICSIYEDKKLWEQLSDEGMAFVRDRFSIESAEIAMLNILRSIKI